MTPARIAPAAASVRPRIDAAEFSARAERFVARHAPLSTRGFIGNLDATIDALRVDGVTLPACINRPGCGNAWISSPLTTYRDYALEEIDRLGHRALTWPLRQATRGVGAWMARAGLDDAVSVNNWLVSTNSYPDLPRDTIVRIADAARARWPTQAIWFRSLNGAHSGAWLSALRDAGALSIPSRQVYLFDDLQRASRERSDLRKDLALLRRSAMQPLDALSLGDTDYACIAALYTDLYLAKYSRLNPAYTPALLRAWHDDGLLDLHGVRDADGVLIGAVGLMRFGNLVTSPIVGYDTALPRRLGLYRLLAATVLDVGRRNGCVVNLSAGVAHFKRQRGGVAAIEYSAVLADHLPRSQQRALRVVAGITRGIGVPIMERLQL